VKGKVITQGQKALGVNTKDIGQIVYVFPRRISLRTILEIKHIPFIYGIQVLHKIARGGMLKIIFIKIIAIHLLLKL